MRAAHIPLTPFNSLRNTLLRASPFASVRHAFSNNDAMARKKNKARKNVTDASAVQSSNQIVGAVNEPLKAYVEADNTFVGQALLDALERDSEVHGQDSNAKQNQAQAIPATSPQFVDITKRKKKKHNERRQQATKEAELLAEPPAGWQQLASQIMQPGDANWSAPSPIMQSIERHIPAAVPFQANLPIHQFSTYQGIGPHYNTVAVFDPEPSSKHPITEHYTGLGQGLWPLQSIFAPVNSSLPVRAATRPIRPYTPYTPVFNHTTQGFVSSLNAAAPSFAPTHKYHTRSQVDYTRDPRVIARQSKLPSPSDAAQSPSPPTSPGPTRKRSPIYSIRPRPDPSYIIQACIPTSRLASPQPLLLISDLNGTLIVRSPTQNAAGFRANFKCRPGLTDFLGYIYSTHTVMIWTSAMPRNCGQICEKLLPKQQLKKTVAIWARDKLGLTPEQFKGHTNVYKRLESVWTDTNIQHTHPHFLQGGRWSQKNTVLIDDSILKASAQPFNLLHIPELTTETMKSEMREAVVRSMPRKVETAKGQHAVLRQVAGYIEEAKWWDDVSSFMRSTPFKIGDGWGGKGKDTVLHIEGEPELNVDGVNGAL